MRFWRLGMRWVGAGFVAAVLMVWVCSMEPLGGRPVWRQTVEREPHDGDDGKMDWSKCRLDLLGIQFTKTFVTEDSVSYFTEFDQETNQLTEDDIENVIALLPPHMKSTVLDCLSKQHFPFLVSGEEESPRNWYTEHLKFIFRWFAGSRRQLADKTSQASTPASAPSPAPSPAHAPAPDLALVPAPGPMVHPPAYPPASYPILTPVGSPSYSGQSPADYPEQIFPALPEGGIPSSPPKPSLILPSKDGDGSNRTMIVAVVLTASSSVLFTSFLFVCYNRFFGNTADSGDGQRDSRPLLTLSSSNFSAGCSQKSIGLHSVGKDKIETHPSQREPSDYEQVSSSPSHNEQVSSSDTNSAGARPSEIVSEISNFSAEPSTTVIPTGPPAPRPPPPPLNKSARPPNPPLPPPIAKSGPRTALPPKGSSAPCPPQKNLSSRRQPSPLGPNHTRNAPSGQETLDDAPKTKLKPFFWDKVLASPDQSMVWHQISSGSFQFNEDMIESLFGYSPEKQTTVGKKKSASSDPSQYIHILDSRKSQNLAILLRALNVTTEEICDALMEGNELPAELLQTLIKMAPTADEELRLRLYAGEISHLGPAERFLKSLVAIPFAFKRLDALLFMGSVEEDISSIKKDLATIEAACKELKGSRLFKKLLEAVVKIGNRMNDGTYRGGAQAFKLDTLLKLADVKGTDGKTTLLHFVVQEIIRSEGMRAEREAKGSGGISSLATISSLKSEDGVDASPCESGDHYRRLGLQVVSGLTYELEDVKNAALLDADTIASMVESLGEGLVKTKEFLNKDMKSMEEDSGFHQSLESFVERAEVDVTLLLKEEKRLRLLVKSTTDFFHENAGKDEGLRLFVIVRDFLGMLDKACKEVRQEPRVVPKTPVNRETSDPSLLAPRQLLFPSIRERLLNSSSSDDESP